MHLSHARQTSSIARRTRSAGGCGGAFCVKNAPPPPASRNQGQRSRALGFTVKFMFPIAGALETASSTEIIQEREREREYSRDSLNRAIKRVRDFRASHHHRPRDIYVVSLSLSLSLSLLRARAQIRISRYLRSLGAVSVPRRPRCRKSSHHIFNASLYVPFRMPARSDNETIEPTVA